MSVVQRLLAKIPTYIQAIRHSCGAVARALLGEIDWHAPPWALWIADRLKAQTRATLDRVRQKPRQAALLAFTTLTIISATYFTYRWYESLPRPVETGFTVTLPGITCYACEPAGKPDPLLLHFDASVAPLAMTDKDLDPKSEIVRISPTLKGTWHWDGDRTLHFQPAADWPIATHFKVNLERHGLVAAHVHLVHYELAFNTPDFQTKLGKTDFHQDPVVANDKKVVVTVTFSHPVDPERLEKRISLTLFERVTDSLERDRGKTPFTVVYDKQRLNAYIHSGQLAVPEKMGRLAIRIEPGLRATRGGNETQSPLIANVSVPGLHSLEVNDVSLQIARNERDEPSQVLLISMNHSVLEREMPRNVHAWVLPTRNPDASRQAQFERYNHGKSFRWSQSSVNSDVLKLAKPLRLAQVQGELEHYELHSFRHEAEPGEFIYIEIDKGLRSFGGYILDRSFEGVYAVPEYPSELRIAQQGSLLALSGDKALTVMSRGVATLHIEAGRLLPAQIQHLVTQTRGDFGAPVFNNYDFDASNITERFTEKIALPASKPGAPHYTAIPLARYLSHDATDHRGVFFMRVQAWDSKHDRPIDALEDTRLIVITDIGLLAKKSVDGSRDVFVQSIHTGEPLADVRIEVLGRNGLPVLSLASDAEGHAHFPDLGSFKREQEPVLYLARRNGDSSFLPVQDRGRALDLSRFDVGGVENRVDEGALSAYLFCDRGLYRPGEEIHAGLIIRMQDWKRSLEGIPLLMQVTDPRGVILRHEKFKPGAGGFSEIRQPTYTTSPAGTYTFSVWLIQPRGANNLIGSTTVQVRDFLPDRLRMSTRFSTERVEGWVSPEGLKANIDLQNLFGTPAANRTVSAHMSLSPAVPTFKQYAGYQFHDPQIARESFEENLTATTTNDKGEAAFDLNLQRFARATYRLEVDTEGFEADGGRGVSSAATQLVSNASYLVGWKADGGLGYVSRDAKRTATFIAIDSHAQMTEVEHLKLALLEIRYVSTLIRQSNGTYQYESRRKEIAVEEHETALPKAGLTLSLASANPGNFAYVMTDQAGQKLARMEYHVAGEANLTRALEKDAQLQISLARHDYCAGEDIEMQIQAPYTGAGLITIERERVYAWHWFRTSTTSSTQKIRLPAGIEGNAYIHVAFIRDPASDEIYASPLSYGVQPFSISLDSHRNPIQLETAALVKPAQTLKIGYSTLQPARIVVFAVDEGILQVAGYHTPDPLSHFFQKRALAIMTTQILDLIMPEFRHGEVGAAAPGGDQGSALARHLNPFQRKGDKPVVYWSNILQSDSTPRQLEYYVPDYFNGTLRIMAVAVNDASIGTAETRTAVRGDFVLSPNAPTTVTPGDRFEVSVGVANNLEGSGTDAKLVVKLETDASLQIEGATSQTLAIAEKHEGVARFRIKTLDELGPANLTFRASSGAASGHRRIDVSVRPATPYMTSLAAGHMRQASKDINLTRNLYPQFRTLEASTSRVPLSLAHGLVTYLANYPYVCTEQIVSQAMPALMLGDRPEFGYVRTAPGANIGGLIDELRVRQNAQGAYKLWPGSDTVIEFVSLYAQHFLLEALDHGESVPGNLVENGNGYLRAVAIRDGNNLAEERDSAYAIYLLTRQGHVMSAEASALRKRLVERYKGQWEQDTAAAWLAASLKLMQQSRDAEKAIAPLRFAIANSADFYNDEMTRDGFLMYVLAKYFPAHLPSMPPEALESLAQNINGNLFHSLSAGTTLMGLNAYVAATHADTDPKLGISEILGDNQAPRPLELPAGLMPKVQFTPDAKALRVTSGTELSAFYLVNESGFERAPPNEALVRGFEILREYTDDHGALVKQVKMGEQVSVHLRFRTIQDHRIINQVALEDLLPGGFDLVVPRDNSGTCGFCTGGSGVSGLDYAEPRADRVVFYTTLSSDVREIIYRIKATNIGTYRVPPAFGEAMYDRNMLARSVAGTIEVVQP